MASVYPWTSMLEQANYLWRLGVTGICFALFSVGGSLLTALVFPPLRLLPGGEAGRNRRTQALIQRFFALLISLLRALGVMRLEFHNAEALRSCGNMLVFANHPSYLDVVVMLSLMPRASCVVNSRLWRSPFWSGVVRAAGYIRNDAPETLVDDCVAAMESGEPLIIFPEGTRSVPGRPLRMSRGAAHIALRSGRDILPVVLSCDPPTLTKGMPWYRIPHRAFTFRLEVRPPLKVADCINIDEPASLASRKLTAYLENYFTRETHHHE
ncbi:MAG: lysophospholipid acyltransferase family protein [Pseudomonadota bacterium]|nr:lysophospholipid acyltransferase family protein [Pseudomonadota bacterium]MDP2352750.1 lysophospholipid acyltransferase family protein [Pseudomonadota bacterium]